MAHVEVKVVLERSLEYRFVGHRCLWIERLLVSHLRDACSVVLIVPLLLLAAATLSMAIKAHLPFIVEIRVVHGFEIAKNTCFRKFKSIWRTDLL